MTDIRAAAERYADSAEEAGRLVALAEERLRWRQRHGYKVCSSCGEHKPAAAFSRDPSRRDGLAHRCRPCDVARKS